MRAGSGNTPNDFFVFVGIPDYEIPGILFRRLEGEDKTVLEPSPSGLKIVLASASPMLADGGVLSM
jgi:hypothetical protein